MKIDSRYHCFGCQADGDVVSFTARFFDLSPRNAALKLASDFGITYDAHSPPRRKAHSVSEADRMKHRIDYCFCELADYRNTLVKWKLEYAPKSPDEEPYPLFLIAVQGLEYVEYQLDVLLYGSNAEKVEICEEFIKREYEKETNIMEPIVKTPVYRESAAYAREHGELDRYRESHRTNVACRNEIEQSIARNFDGMHLKNGCVKDVLALYGVERVQTVLAATVQQKEWDGRFSKSNKDWAFSIPLPDTSIEGGFDRRSEFEVTTHPAVLDGFISLIRKEIREMEQAAVKPIAHKKTKETEVAR